MADDIAYDNIGCYGSTHFKTPCLDELAKTGVKFNFCYSEPVCTASRVKIMTGRDNIRNYTVFGKLDPKEQTFGTMMQNAGYDTAIAGKWQLHGNNGALAPDTISPRSGAQGVLCYNICPNPALRLRWTRADRAMAVC